MEPRAEFFYDEESENWGFHVPARRIVGSGKTRAEAERNAAEAISFALECEREEQEHAKETSEAARTA